MDQRFGVALRRDGQLKLHQAKFKKDFQPIDENCDCSTCKHYTRAYLSHIVRLEAVGASLLTIHNVAFQVFNIHNSINKTNIYYTIYILSRLSFIFQLRLMKDIRESIKIDKFLEFVKTFMQTYFKDQSIPEWIISALAKVNIQL